MADILDFKKKYEQRFLRTLTGKFVDVQFFAAVPDGERMHVLQYTEVEANMVANGKPGEYHCIEKARFDDLFHKAEHPLGYDLSKHFAQAGAKDVPTKVEARLYFHHIDKVQRAFNDGSINGKMRIGNGDFIVTPKGGEPFILSLDKARRRIRQEVQGALKIFPF